MATERIYQDVRGETGLSDVKITIYNSSGTVVVSAASMTELGSTGIYYYDYTWTTGGKYLAVISSSEIGFQDSQNINLGLSISEHVPSSSVSYIDIKADIGMIYDAVDIGTTSTIIGKLISAAEEDIKDVTGTTTGYAQPIRYLADAYTVQNVLGGLGPESNSEAKLINMRDSFMDRCKTSLRRLGFNYENLTPSWVQVNG